MRISDWSSDVGSSDLGRQHRVARRCSNTRTDSGGAARLAGGDRQLDRDSARGDGEARQCGRRRHTRAAARRQAQGRSRRGGQARKGRGGGESKSRSRGKGEGRGREEKDKTRAHLGAARDRVEPKAHLLRSKSLRTGTTATTERGRQ